MKTFRLLGLAAVAVLMSFAFASCDDDETADDPLDIVMTQWDIIDCDDDVYYEFNDPTSIVFYDDETGRLYCDGGRDYVSFTYEERGKGMLEIHLKGYDYWEGDWQNYNDGYNASYDFSWGGESGHYLDLAYRR